jgi:hypothetical protein
MVSKYLASWTTISSFPPVPPARFYNGVTDIVEFSSLTPKDIWGKHNPVYHLERYVDGMTPAELASRGIEPGTWWDINLVKQMKAWLAFDTGIADKVLYDACLFGTAGSGIAESTDAVLARFDQITLSDLSGYQFLLDRGATFEMYAASGPGLEWDIALATGNPYDPEARLIRPLDTGTLDVFLQMRSEGPMGYITLAQGTLTYEVVPAPGAMILCAVGLSYAGCLLHRKTQRDETEKANVTPQDRR